LALPSEAIRLQREHLLDRGEIASDRADALAGSRP
jgi:hypothetical protein